MPNYAADVRVSPLAPAESSAAIAHLNMLQSVITRLAGNSVQCKTWCVALVSALFGLAGATKSGRIAVSAIIPIVVFAFVDAYLSDEKAYRDLFNKITIKIREGKYELADFGNLSAATDARHLLRALASWSLWPVYFGLLIAYLSVVLSGFLT